MKTKILPVLFLAFITLGCGGRRDSGDDSQLDGPAPNEGAGVSRSGASGTEVIVTSDDASLPDGCDTRQITELVIECADAFNRGDQERLSRLFFVSEGPSLRISLRKVTTRGRGTRCEVGEGGRIENGFVTHDQGELLRSFAERYGQRERLTWLKVSSTQAGLLEEEYNAGIVLVLTRDAESTRSSEGRRVWPSARAP